ncbi:CDP-glycerol glycerophosphotransferase family protein [Catenibacillus scindens]|uniref:CDP-glycerol glycerophosphotransferase family protein n=1 Tax=Catenibacillus scindens TaxID=673271 RepID=UPI003207A9A4
MEETVLTIIILENTEHTGLEDTLRSILAQTYSSYKIYYLTHSKDLCIGTDSEKLPPYEILSPEGSVTRSQLYNYALSKIHTPYVLFMEERDTLAPAFIEKAIAGFEAPHFTDDETSPAADISICVGKAYCRNPVVSPKSVEHILSKKYIRKMKIEPLDQDFTPSSGDEPQPEPDSANLLPVRYTYVRDVFSRPDGILITMDGCIIKTEAAKSVGFKDSLTMEEEADFILRFLLKYKSYYAVPGAKYYYYAPRANEVLYHQNAHFDAWYETSMEQFIFPLLDDARKMYGSIPIFLQNYCMFYMNCRFMSNQDNRDKKILLGDRLDTYLSLVTRLFQNIDDEQLLNQSRLPYVTTNPEIRCMYLRIKYGVENVRYDYIPVNSDDPKVMEIGGRDLEMRFGDHLISQLSAHRISINIMNYIDGDLWIDGSLISIFQYGDIRFFATFNGQDYPITDTTAYSQTKYFGVPGYRRLPFFLKFHLDSGKKLQRITFYAKFKGEKFPMKMTFANHWAKLSKSPRYSYWRFNKYLCHHANNGISIKRATTFNVLKRELQLQLQLFHKKDKSPWKFRMLYWLTRPYFRKKRIWLMLDKLYKGGDSAEYLYRYSGKQDDGITKYYLINKNTSDYKKLRRDGFRPLVNGSLFHKLVFVNADILLITNSHLFPFNGYTKETSKYIRGLCNFGSMCLQHGLSVQKCAIAQRRIIDNTMMYFLGSKYEYENLSRHAYGYQGFDMLKLTGIGRYDGLVNQDKKQILISPTWRMYNALPVTTSEGEQRGYNPEFKHTTYFHIYNTLINNEKLIETARKYGYKIKYLLHPIISSQVEDFTPNPELEVIPSVGDLSYEEILTQSSLMVTDYSGVQFDFAYMRKPVVYFHPEDLPPHYEDGVFFYDTMGFGEICRRLDQLVDTLCEYMASGCEMKEMYRLRADDFFAHNDHHNCERIYKEIYNYQKMIDRDKLRPSMSPKGE